MFMSAREIRSTHQASDWDMSDPVDPSGEPEPEDELWNRKLAESKEGVGSHTLYRSVQEKGVKNPVHLSTQFGALGRPQVAEGHHRIAVSDEAFPDRLMPVLHHETPEAVGDYVMDYENITDD